MCRVNLQYSTPEMAVPGCPFLPAASAVDGLYNLTFTLTECKRGLMLQDKGQTYNNQMIGSSSKPKLVAHLINYPN